MNRSGSAHHGWAIVMLAALSLGACDNGTSAPGEQRQSSQPATGDPVEAPAKVVPPAGGAPNITGKVSSLTGDLREFTIRITASSTIVELPSDTLFAFDKADLTAHALQTLPKVAKLIREGGNGEIVVAGHSDALGADDYNLALSKRRAEAVRDWFVEQQVAPADRFQIEAVGKGRPIAPNTNPDGSDNPAGRAQNRRVEIIIPRA